MIAPEEQAAAISNELARHEEWERAQRYPLTPEQSAEQQAISNMFDECQAQLVRTSLGRVDDLIAHAKMIRKNHAMVGPLEFARFVMRSALEGQELCLGEIRCAYENARSWNYVPNF